MVVKHYAPKSMLSIMTTAEKKCIYEISISKLVLQYKHIKISSSQVDISPVVVSGLLYVGNSIMKDRTNILLLSCLETFYDLKTVWLQD